ncbi:MAG: WD40 repeat-containing protein [Anaerolineaceae bacterium]|nr:MAG: WD40 repeat-containing protein [Anaerolineaceae bacterium]
MNTRKAFSILLGICLALSAAACTPEPATPDRPALPPATQRPTRTPRDTQAPPVQPSATATRPVQPSKTPVADPASILLTVDYGSEGKAFEYAFIAPYGRALVVFLDGGDIQVFHLEDGWTATFPLPLDFMFPNDAISVQPSKILFAEYYPNENGNITIWQVTPGSEAEAVATITETDGWVTTLAFSPDGKTLAAGFNLGEIRLYSTSNGTRLRSIKAFNDFVMSMAYSPDGRYIIADSFSFDPNTYVFNASSGSKTATLSTESWEPGRVSFSPDGTLAAATAGDGTHIFTTGNWQPTGTVIGIWEGTFTCDSLGFMEVMGDLVSFYSLDTGQQTGTMNLPDVGDFYCLTGGRSAVINLDYDNYILTLRLVTP